MVSALSDANKGPKAGELVPYRILAMSREPEKHGELGKLRGVQLVKGDLNDPLSVESIFAHEGEGAISGVFFSLPFPGLGKPADAELAQGKVCPIL